MFQCQDYNAYCAAWAREGQCRKNQAYMDIYCAKVGTTYHYQSFIWAYKMFSTIGCSLPHT